MDLNFGKKRIPYLLLIAFTLSFYNIFLNTNDLLIFWTALGSVATAFWVFLFNRNNLSIKMRKQTKINKLLIFVVVFTGILFSFVDILVVFLKLNYHFDLFKETPSIWIMLIQNKYFFIFYITLLAPVMEEVIFRKYLLTIMTNSRIPFSGLLVSLAFVLIHKSNSLSVFLLVFLVSTQANNLYLKTGRVILSIIFHSSCNLGSILFYGVLHSDISGLNKFVIEVLYIVLGFVFLIYLDVILLGGSIKKRNKSPNRCRV